MLFLHFSGGAHACGHGFRDIVLLLGNGRQTQELAPVVRSLREHLAVVVDTGVVGSTLGHHALVKPERGEVGQEGTHRTLASRPPTPAHFTAALRARMSVAIVTSPGSTQPVRT